MAVHKPAPLSPGARIGVVAPAGSVDRRSLLAGVAAIEAQGYAVELAQNVFQTKGYLAGEPACRAGDLTNFFRRDDIAAIFCARGGFGSIQMLEFLTDEVMRHPKIFVGYSDNTVLLDWLRARCGMVTFHGPMVAMDLAQGISSRSGEHLWGMLSGRKRAWKLSLGEVIRHGKIEAEMTGGCLSLLVTTLGTTYEIDTRGRILFLEDIGERPYRIERMLTHLKMAGKLDHLAGVVFGDFTRCEGEGPRDVRAVIGDLFAQAPYPVVMGLPAGHGEENLALPFGVNMRLDGDGATLEMLESPVL
jgi:muramoyltetrapeptide carboxypeptidase